MQRKECNCARIGVANNRDKGGGNCGLGAGKVRKLWRIVRSTFLGLIIAGALSLLLAPLHGRADEDMDRHFGGGDEDQRGLHKEIVVLEAKIATLEATLSSLEGKVTTLQTQLAAVRSNPALALGPFVSVDPNPEVGVIGPNITFSGANIHIVSGSQATDDHGNPTGLGNLIIGYDEDPNLPLTGDSTSFGIPIMQLPGGPSPLLPGDRGGSHNLVIGPAIGSRRRLQAASWLVSETQSKLLAPASAADLSTLPQGSSPASAEAFETTPVPRSRVSAAVA